MILSIQSLAITIADTLADWTGVLNRPIPAASLISRAQSLTGLTDFGDLEIAEPLARLLDACVSESHLSLIGRLATRWDMVRFLSNLLRMHAAEQAEPRILKQIIRKPIIITGLPRSGTTFLHRLMLEDPANRAPLVWETIYPFPDDARSGRRTGTRPARVARQLRAFEALAPDFRALHPLDATSPQECSEITAHVFRSLRFDTTYHIPSYRGWLDGDPGHHLPAYRFHKRFLRHLAYQDPPSLNARRWVLKCPEHLFALGAIRAVYPDARLVFVHRDPVRVLASQARLTEVLRRPFTRSLDRTSLGQHESTRWLDGTRRMIAAGDDAGLPDPVCHVHHLDLISDPVATAASVYRHFGVEMPAPAASAMARFVAARPNGGYGQHRYRWEDHGLDPGAERERFRPYMLHFGIDPETGGQPPRRMPVALLSAEAPVERLASDR
jgi:hypothetical protein